MNQLINAFSAEWANLFLMMSLQNVIFLSIVLLLLYFFRNSNARMLRMIALIGLVKLLIPPVLYFPTSITSVTETLSNITGVFTLQPIIVTAENSFSSHTILFILWLSITLLLLMIIILRTVVFSKNLSKRKPILIDKIFPELQWPNIRLYQSEQVHSPLVIGFFKYKIILPDCWQNYSKDELRLILLHELAHIRQKDQWINLIQNIVQAIHFFNPFVWLLTERIRQLSEMTGDDYTVSMSGINRKSYMKSLINISEMSHKKTNSLPLSLAFSETYFLIKNRINYQLARKESLSMKRLTYKNVIVITTLLLIMVSFSWKCSSDTTESQDSITEQQFLEQIKETADEPMENVFDFMDVDVKPVLVKKVLPKYPADARKAGIQGKVVVTVTINEEGQVEKTTLLKSVTELDAASIDAAKQCKFEPAMKDGKPVKVTMNMPFDFRLK